MRRALAAAAGVALTLAALGGDAAACDGAGLKIAIDIGHSPRRPGAISARGAPEYAFNKRLAEELAARLRGAGFDEARVLNPEGAELALLERTAAPEAAEAAFFVSIHHDSVQPRYLERWSWGGRDDLRHSTRAEGYSIFVSSRNAAYAQSLAAARLLGEALRRRGLVPSLHHAEKIKGEGRDLLDPELGIYDFPGLAVLRSAPSPALLFEAGVIVNREEEARLDTPEHRRLLTDALAETFGALCAASPSD